MLTSYIENNKEELIQLVRELCKIPAPSHHEEKRAEFCKNWLEKHGAKGVYIDEALNVVFPLNCENSNEITVVVAHTDTVFPDTEPMPYREDDEKIYSPGAGDDTASVAVLLLTAKYFIEKNIMPEKGILFVMNSCEEGLGNLKGTRRLMHDFSGRVAQFVSFDAFQLCYINHICVGSHRYEVTVETEGGHSFQKFGNQSAVAILADMISQIYRIEVPQKADTKTTYNVGSISGGTSVNTIPQEATMLCEYRSNDRECMEIMRQKFEEIFEGAKSDKVAVNVKKIGDRPCAGEVDPKKQQDLLDICALVVEETLSLKPEFRLSSTDCNIPLSMGIPSVCIGVFNGQGAHTREEWIEKASLPVGLLIGIQVLLRLTK